VPYRAVGKSVTRFYRRVPEGDLLGAVGGFVNDAVGGIPVVGGLLQGIGSFFGHLFGGPSPEEMAAAKKFIATNMMGPAQAIASQAKTTLGLLNALHAYGFTPHGPGLQDVRKGYVLWTSPKVPTAAWYQPQGKPVTAGRLLRKGA